MATLKLAIHTLDTTNFDAMALDLDPVFIHEGVLDHAAVSQSSARKAARQIEAHSEKLSLQVAGAVLARDEEKALRLAKIVFAYRFAAAGFEQHALALEALADV